MKKNLLSIILCLWACVGYATTTYYSAPTGNLNNLSTWVTGADGLSGTPAPNFTANGQIFEITNGSTHTISANWTVGGTGSKIVVGDGASATNFIIPAAFTVTGTINVTSTGTVTVQNDTPPSFGSVDSLSTIVFSGTGSLTIATATGTTSWGNLVIAGARTGSPTITLGSASAAVLNVTSISLTATGVGSYTSSGTINYYKGVGGVTVASAITYNNLQMSNTSGTNTADGNLNATGTLTTTLGGSLNMGTYMLSAGVLANSGTILTQNLSATPIPSGKVLGGTIVYNALTGGQTVVSETSYNNLTLANTSGTDVAGGSFAVNGALTTTAGGKLDMTSAYSLSGTPTVTNNGTISTSVLTATTATPLSTGRVWGGSGTVMYAATTGAQTIVGGTYNCKLRLSNTSGVDTATQAITANDSLVTTAGGVFGTSAQLKGTINIGNNGTIRTASTGVPILPSGYAWGGTVVFDKPSGTGGGIPTGTYNNLTIANAAGTYTVDGTFTVNGALVTTSTSTLAMGTTQLIGSPTSITHNGTLTTSSTANPAIPTGDWSGTGGTSNVTFSLVTGGQFIPGGTYKTLFGSNTSGTNNVTGNLVVTTSLKVAALGGTLDMGTNKMSGSFAVANTGFTLLTQNSSSAALPPGKTWGLSSSAATVMYNGTGAQTIAAGSYNNLQISGTRTGSPVITLAGSATDTIAVGGDFNVTATGIGSYAPGLNTFAYFSTNNKNVAGIPYYNLLFTNTGGTKTATGNITVNNMLLTTNGGTFAMDVYSLGGALNTVTNNGTIKTLSTTNPALPAGNSWTGTQGVVEFSSLTGGQYIPGGTYKALKCLATSDTNRVVGDLTITGALTIAAATSTAAFKMGTHAILALGSTVTTTGFLFTENTSSFPVPDSVTWRSNFVYDASGSQKIVGGVYIKSLYLSGARTGTPTITLDSFTTIALSQDFITNYTGAVHFVTTGSTVKYNSTLPGIIAPITYGNLYISAPTVKTAGGNIGINDTLVTLTGSTLDLLAYDFTGTLSNVINAGIIKTASTHNPAIPAGTNWSLSASGGIVEFASPTGGQFIPAGTFSSIQIDNMGSGKDSIVGNIIMNLGVLNDSGILDFGPATLSGIADTAIGNGTILTASTSASPLPTGMMWGPLVVYNKASGGQTIVPGTYNGGLTNSNSSGLNFVMNDSTVNVNGTLTLSAGSALSDSGGIINLTGNLAGTGTHSGSGKISMNGATAQTISGATLGNLELNNAAGFTTTGAATVNGTLTLTSGVLNIGSNNFNFGASAGAVAGTPGTSSMIIASTGEVRKMFADVGSFLYPIGDSALNYTPVTLNFTSGTFAGGAYAGVKVKNVKHPFNSNPTDFINRYWSIHTSGITSPVSNINATYAEGDIVGTESLITAAKFSSALPWIKFGPTNTTTDLLSGTGIVDANFDFSGISGVGPVINVTPASPTICSGNSVVLDASGTTGIAPLTYSWSPAAGLSATTGSSVTVTITSSVTTTAIYTITATDGNGISSSSTVTVSVNALASAIGGATNVCAGATTTLTNSTSGGTWASSDSTIATVDSTSGVVTGVVAGVVTITYTAPGGCNATSTMTVFAIPTAITGSGSLCTGGSATFTNGVSGGTWTSGNTAVATVGSATGSVLAVGAGNTLISYTVPGGCGTATKALTVDVAPDAGSITGASAVLTGATITLSDAASGGVWSASNSNATVSVSGVVTGIAAGVVDISYTVTTSCGSATATKTVTVTATIGSITGVLSVCVGGTTNLFDGTPGGNWTSSGFPSIINIGFSTGVVTGVSAGTAMVTYGGPGNYAYAIVTVNPLPTPISGPASICLNTTTTLSNSITGGTWTSSNATIASIDPSSGLVTGNAAGSATITYTLPTGCLRTSTMTIKPLPSAIVGANNVCAGSTTTLTDPTTGGVLWSSSDPSIASIGAASGIVTGVTAGTATITYTVVSGCVATKVMTVDPGLPAITGALNVCIGFTTTLSDATTGGVWSNSAPTVATIGSSSGVVTGLISGTSVISYTVGSCRAVAIATVNTLPAVITGSPGVCIGSTNILSDATTGGTWSSSSTGIASIGSATGVLTGVSAGNATITYSSAIGCIRTVVATVSTAPLITGTMSLCIGNTATLSSSITGGTWSSSNATVATIGSATGILTGISLGNSNITYTYSPTCKSSVTVTVSTAPSTITGPATVCGGGNITLSSATSGGVWSSSNTSIATVGAGTGVVTGVGSGTVIISYATGAGCYQVKSITVGSGLGSITGGTGLCIGASVTYVSTSPSVGVGWSSSNPSVASVGALSGVVTGVTSGTANITFTPYSFSAYAGCTAIKTVTVDAVPSVSPITGLSGVHIGSTITLADATAGGVWTSNSPARATIDAGGVVTGLAAPAVTISYSVTNGACVYSVTKLLTVTSNRPGITSNGSDEFAVYPNPTSGTFTISAPVAGTFTMYSLEGREVMHTAITEGLNPVNMPNGLAAGVYMCRFNGADESTVMVRLVYEAK